MRLLTSKEDIYEVGTMLFSLIGEHVQSVTIKLIVYRIFNTLSVIFLSVFIIPNFFRVKSDMYVSTLESLVQMTHVRTKYIKVSTSRSSLN